MNPQDPEGHLLNATWWSSTARPLYEANLHLVSQNGVPYAYYLVPVIASSGPDRKLGISPVAANTPDPMQTASADANDNLYNFRLRIGGRGD